MGVTSPRPRPEQSQAPECICGKRAVLAGSKPGRARYSCPVCRRSWWVDVLQVGQLVPPLSTAFLPKIYKEATADRPYPIYVAGCDTKEGTP